MDEWMDHCVFRARCNKGHFVIYDDQITIERRKGLTILEGMQRSQIVGIDVKTVMPSIFGFGGATTINIYSTGGKVMSMRMIKPKSAKKIRSILLG